MRRIVVLGTGTGVGKTYVTRCLARALAQVTPHGSVVALKPIETGVAPGVPSDAGALAEVAQGCALPSPHPLYSFREPLTPYLAALREGRPPVELEAVQQWLAAWEGDVSRATLGAPAQPDRPDRSASAHGPDWAIIETAGGVFSPLAVGLTNFDLWLALEPCAAVLVARDGLGTLHDVTATLEALAARGRRPEHLVLTTPRRDPSTGTNASVLEALGIATPTAVLATESDDLLPLARALAAGSSRLSAPRPLTE